MNSSALPACTQDRARLRRVWRNGGFVVTERRRRRENNGTADLWPPNGIRVAAVELDVVNENNVLSDMLPVRPVGSQTSTALDVSLLLLLVSVGVAEPRSTV